MVRASFCSVLLNDEGRSAAFPTINFSSMFTIHTNSYTNWMGPSTIVLADNGYQFFTQFVFPPMRALRFKGIECTRVDMVGHSMGGLMIKAFANSDYFRIAPNYRQGAIRRVVTIGTPHWGSGSASYFAGEDAFLRNKAFSEGAPTDREKALVALNTTGHLSYDNNGLAPALMDLRLFSPVIRELNKKACDIPTHLIAGDFGVSVGFLRHAMSPYTHEDLFNDVEGLSGGAYRPENSDESVGLSSARWACSGLTGAQSETVDVKHTAMTGNEGIANRVAKLLAGDLTPFGKPAASSLPQRVAARSRTAQTPADVPKIDEEAILAQLLRLNLTASATTAAPGGTVTLELRPDEGVALEEAGVLDEDGNVVP